MAETPIQKKSGTPGRRPAQDLANGLQLTLYHPHKKQAEVHQVLNDEKSNVKFAVCIAGRQAGKSALAMNQLVFWAYYAKKGSLIWWISPTDVQAKGMYRQVLDTVKNIEDSTKKKLVAAKRGGGGQTLIELTTGVTIEFKSAASEDSLRGASVSYLIIDEAAFIPESTLNYIILPTLSVRGRKALFISTPKGKNWLYKWYLRGLSGDEANLTAFKFTSFDNPHQDKDLVEGFRRMLPEAVFKQEFEAEFVDSASVFRNVTVNDDPAVTDRLYAGLDIGMVNDYTVLTIINQFGHTLHTERFRTQDATVLKKTVDSTLRRFGVTKMLMEVNNQGLPIYSDLVNVWSLGEIIESFKTTAESKPYLINQLVNAFAESRVTVKSNPPEVKSELESFIFDFSGSGRVRYKAPEGMNDDCVISLALAYECLQRFRNEEAFTDEVYSIQL